MLYSIWNLNYLILKLKILKKVRRFLKIINSEYNISKGEIMKKKTNKSKFFREKLPLYYYLLKNKKTPKLAKGSIIALIIFIISPIDIVPDTIPILGLVDDIALLPLVGMLVSKVVPEDIWEESRERTNKLWFNSKKYKIYLLLTLVILIILVIILLRNLIQN